MKKNIKTIIFYILSFTWGIIMTLVGGLAALVLICTGHRPTVYGGCLCFEVGSGWGAVSLGLVMVCSKGSSNDTKNHELGHAIQNALLGPLFIIFVAIPSLVRSQYRKWLYTYNRKKYYTLPDYDAIWFEGGATRLGKKYIKEW